MGALSTVFAQSLVRVDPRLNGFDWQCLLVILTDSAQPDAGGKLPPVSDTKS